MPELPLRILTLSLSTKSPYDLSVQRNSFFLRSPLVRPTISPFSTVNSSLSSGVTQPDRSLPLKRGLKPSLSSARAEGAAITSARHAARPNGKRGIVEISLGVRIESGRPRRPALSADRL